MRARSTRSELFRPTGAAILALVLLLGAAVAAPSEDAQDADPNKDPGRELVDGGKENPAGDDAKNEESVDELLASIEASLSKVKTVQTDFTQTKKLKLFKKPVVLKGRIYMRFPDRLAWHVQEPLRYALILDKDVLRQWDEDTDEEQSVSLADNPTFKTVSSQIKSWFSGQYSKLVKEYDVTVESREPELRLAFTPKKGSMAGKAIKSVAVTFAEDRAYVRSIRFEETNGDISTLEFSNTKLDEAIPKSAWQPRPRDD